MGSLAVFDSWGKQEGLKENGIKEVMNKRSFKGGFESSGPFYDVSGVESSMQLRLWA